MIKTVYDALLEQYVSIDLGNTKTSFAETIVQDVDAVSHKDLAQQRGALEKAIEHATDSITGGRGGHVRMMYNPDGEPEEILIMDTDDVATARRIWRWNKNGLGYSSTGYNGEYGLAMTADGQIVADFVATGSLNASVIKTGILQSKDGETYYLDVDQGILKLKFTGDNLTVDGKTVNQMITETVGGAVDDVSGEVDALSERVTQAETTLDVQAGQIAAKASQTSVDDLTGA